MNTQAEAAAALAGMKRSLQSWLRYRDMVDKARASADDVSARAAAEPALAEKLHALLTEMYGPSRLPNDAVGLARLVLSGARPESLAPTAAGFPWPIAIVVGGAVIFLSMVSQNIADAFKEQEKQRCRDKYGLLGVFICADTWLQYAVIGGGAYLLWTKTKIPQKLGLKAKGRR